MELHLKYDVGADVAYEVRKVVNDILEQREEILAAFVAQHGYLPDEIEQITEHTMNGMKWYVRRRKKDEHI